MVAIWDNTQCLRRICVEAFYLKYVCHEDKVSFCHPAAWSCQCQTGGFAFLKQNLYQLQIFSSAASNSTGVQICAYIHTYRMCSQGGFSLFFILLNLTGGHKNNTGNKEWRQLPEGKDTFHEDSLINISWKQILRNQFWMGKTESLGRWLNTTGHEWKQT